MIWYASDQCDNFVTAYFALSYRPIEVVSGWCLDGFGFVDGQWSDYLMIL
jgi:hypothetical protein